MNKIRVCEKRIFAIFIDFVIMFFTAWNIGYLVSLFFLKIDIALIIINAITLILFYTLMIYKDTVFSSGSIGKKIWGIGIYVGDSNKFASKKLKIERNKEYIKDIHSFDIFRIEKNNKSGADIKYNTRVDNIKKN